ncbi:MAG: hypothetical protein ACFFC7_28935 [Candidatus Hermodarchaeota archaeon]
MQALRDFGLFEWYVIPLLAIVLFIYGNEIKKARETGDWGPIFAGLALFGMDIINETINAYIEYFTQPQAALWSVNGPTAYQILVGWNIEIAFMFSIAGVVFANFLSLDKFEPIDLRFVRLPNRWVTTVLFTAFCVFVELILNAGGYLVWTYPFWNANLVGIWPIFFLGYFHFFVVAFLVHDMETIKNQALTVGIIYAIGLIALLLGVFVLGWI